MEFSVSFNESISVEGNPRLILNIGGVNRYAYYYEATSTSTVKKFRYQVDSGNILLDLNGLSLTTSIDLYGGSITDLAGNPASSYTISYSEKDYVYFTNLEARYHVRSGDYTYSPASGQLSVWKDVTGKGNNLTQTINMNKPTVASTGFGNNSTGYVNFSSSNAFLIIQQDMTIRYAFFALKTPSVTSGLQKFGLITQAVDSSYWDGIDLNWVFQTDYHETLSLVSLANGNKAMLFDPYAKYKMNSDVFNNNYIDKIDTSTLWTPSTNYLMMFEYQSPITLEGSSDINHGDSTIGAFYDEMTLNSFKGQISEIIFASGTLSATQINLIRDQLNDIHGIY